MPAIASAAGGWRASFAAEAALLGAIFAAWLLAPAVPGVRRPGSMLDALRCANCWLVSLQHAAGFGLAIASGAWISLYLLREYDLPLALSGLLGSILLVLAVLTRPLGGLLVSRHLAPTKAVMRMGNAAVIVGAIVLLVPSRPLPVALLGAIVVGAGVGLPYAPVFNTAAASLRTAPAAAQGLAAAGGTAGVMIGAPIMGYAVQTWGFGGAWLFVAALAAIALVGTYAMRGEEELVRSDPTLAAADG
jgi:NNP family nitrate/nitrite transporter-like MFS transporter